MDTLKAQILDSIRKTGSYHYSTDLATKALEINAVKELEEDGSITSVVKALGYVDAEPL